ncbi:MAG: adenylyltransferase/cytidyltransferase family protein [Paracoccaceae bacterium]
MSRKIITYGTFDLFHIGHVRLLERLKTLGDHLTVCVSTDEFNALKGKTAVMPYAQRAEVVAACRFVDRVLPEEHWDQKREDILREKIDVFAMGDDWVGKFDDLADICEVVYLPRTKDISSTALKAVISAAQDSGEESGLSADTLAKIIEAAQRGTLDRKAYQRFFKLLSEKEDKSSTLWLRCWILLHCLTKKKAIKTQAYISKYNRISRRRKLTAEYVAFMEMLFEELGLLRPINGKFSQSFGTGDRGVILAQSGAVIERLSAYGLVVFANSGTLLGLVREGTLLAHDNDIDFAVLLNAESADDAAQEWLALTDRMISDGLAAQRSTWSGVTLKLQQIGGFGADLFPAWCDAKGRLYIYPHTPGTLSRDALLPLRVRMH